MIYSQPDASEPLDQGDVVDDCPVLRVANFHLGQSPPVDVSIGLARVLIVTQTCDLANEKTLVANAAEVFDAQHLIDQKILKPVDIKGPLRGGRIWGFYFLPAQADLGLPEMIVDLRRLHTVRLDLLTELCRGGKRRARLPVPYREHLAKHFADTFSRIGLPRPYETL
jgi:hypothetical protein